MDTDELGRITRRAYLLELALAGLEAHARHSSPTGPQRHYEPVRELADDTPEVRGARKIAAARRTSDLPPPRG
jgi:hypothetical protein